MYTSEYTEFVFFEVIYRFERFSNVNSMGEKNRELRMELFDSDDPRERDR